MVQIDACTVTGICIWRSTLIIHAIWQPRVVIDGVSSQARIGQLVSVSSMRYRTSTSDLSRSWSSTVLRNLILREASRLDAFSGYPVHT